MDTYARKVAHLRALVTKAETSYASAVRLSRVTGRSTPVRHKCFVCYHSADIDAVTRFIEDYNDVFIPRVLGVSDSDHFKDPVDSTDEDYIKATIGAKYLSDSTVTILYVGCCAWSRKYIDWELSSTLRDDSVNKRNGLLGITPPDNSHNRLPARFDDNYSKNQPSYAEYRYYPTSASVLRNAIEDAFDARTTRTKLVDNTRSLRRMNSPC